MHITKIIITGANGYLSHRLVPMALARGIKVIGVTRRDQSGIPGAPAPGFAWHQADLRNPEQVDTLFARHRPDAVIHAAAANPGQSVSAMDEVNHLGTANIARNAARYGARLVAVSTDVVLNGTNAPFDDDAPADPLNDYGRTKAQGETAIRASCPDAAIVRTSLIYGLQQIDRGTAGFVARLKAAENLNLFDDVIRQPVWADTLANVLCDLALDKTEISGTLNVAGDQPLSRAEFALRMLRYWGVDTSHDSGFGHLIRRVSGAGVMGLPMDLRLRCDRAASLGWLLPGVDAVLDRGDVALAR